MFLLVEKKFLINKNMDVVRKRKVYLSIAGALVLVSWLLVVILGLRSGIDLKGGTSWNVAFQNKPSIEEVRSTFKDRGGVEASIKTVSDGSFILRFPHINEEAHQAYLSLLQEEFGALDEKSFSSIGPTIGSELRRRSLWAIILVILGISFFVAWAFRKVSKPISSWKYGVVTLVTLFHDISIPTGLLAVLGAWKGVEIDTNFIVALLVVMGFSVHDTIVVFDRIRENLLSGRGKNIELDVIINQSVRDTLARSLNTSLTLVFVLVTLLILGPPTLFYFILTVLVGTIMGTYSSIFVASPILYVWGKRKG